jgi:hypothetical protein
MKRVSSETLYFYDSWVIPIIRDKYATTQLIRTFA